MPEARWHKAFELFAHITWATRLRVRAIARRHVAIIGKAILDAAERHKAHRRYIGRQYGHHPHLIPQE